MDYIKFWNQVFSPGVPVFRTTQSTLLSGYKACLEIFKKNPILNLLASLRGGRKCLTEEEGIQQPLPPVKWRIRTEFSYIYKRLVDNVNVNWGENKIKNVVYPWKGPLSIIGW